MRISDALKQTRDLKVDFGPGGVLNVVYRPPSWTPAEMQALKDQKDVSQIVPQIRKLVVQWDLTDDYNNLIPLDPPPMIPAVLVRDENGDVTDGALTEVDDPLMHVPISIYLAIIRAVNEDGKPSPQA